MSRRSDYLKEMGVGAVWTLRDRSSMIDASMTEALITETAVSDSAFLESSSNPDASSFDELPPQLNETQPATVQHVLPDVSGMDWEELEATIQRCHACRLCQGRTQAVPGVGDRNATWLFVGEGPGFYEDQQGEPFVGASGKLLDNMLSAIALKRGSNAYIANIVKCRATDNSGKDRAPTPDEAASCHPYLEQQIALIKPKIIIAVGRVAATTLLRTDPQTPLAVLRGKAHLYQTPDGRTIPLVATYHPAYLLRQLSEKRKAWEDLCLAMRSFPTQD